MCVYRNPPITRATYARGWCSETEDPDFQTATTLNQERILFELELDVVLDLNLQLDMSSDEEEEEEEEAFDPDKQPQNKRMRHVCV